MLFSKSKQFISSPLLTKLYSTSHVPVTVCEGDGIGPEICESTVKILEKAGASISWEKVEVGEKVYKRGVSSGIEASAWESIRRTKVMLKAPITTPSGGGYKSLNVTMRKTLGLYSNVRPCQSYAPFIKTKHPNMNVVIVRENEEDLYAGIEHHQTDEVVQCLKLISRPGCEKIINYAFEYAKRNNRKLVSCFVKGFVYDNIMKMTDGMFYKVFEEIKQRYEVYGIKTDKWIIDIGAARLADTPEIFDVIVCQNLYGDIISDIAAQITGSVGLGASSNIGDHAAMFEAIHGSAPNIAGLGVANPSGLLLSSVMLLNHIDQNAVAEKVHNAWLKTIEDGVHTVDIYDPEISKQKVSTSEFTQAVMDRLGASPSVLKAVNYTSGSHSEGSMRDWKPTLTPRTKAQKQTVGVDIFLHWSGGPAETLAQQIQLLNGDGLQLTLVTNRGVKVWPQGFPETFLTDHWRLRFKSITGRPITNQQIISLLLRISNAGFDYIKIENLYMLDGKPGFSLGQGE